MKNRPYFILFIIIALLSAKNTVVPTLRDGDIIFQSSMSGQSYAIQLATHSKYSHCGLLFFDGGKWMVYEAVQPVKKTAFSEWIKHGDGQHYVVKRLIKADSILNDSVVALLKNAANKRMGRDYDLYFNWDEERIYCSELVWKSYHDATGLEVGIRKPLKSYDLSSPVVKKKLQEPYGDSIPADELMISPGEIFDSPLLKLVQSK